MLTHLSISNLTLVDRLELEFSPGMSVITGETGAGKSIMLAALGLVTGDRGDYALIGKGTDKAEIGAAFEVGQRGEVVAWLQARGLEDGQQCILRRVLSQDGRSRAFVNGTLVNVSDLKSLGELLVDIHSQHEHQSLLRKGTHLLLLDAYGGLEQQAQALAEIFHDYAQADERLRALHSSRDEQAARSELLAFQLEELNELAVEEGETEALEVEHKRLQNAETSQQQLAEVIRLLTQDEEATAATLLGRAVSLLTSLEDERLQAQHELLETSLIQLNETVADLRGQLDDFNADPTRLQAAEERLSRIYEIARKHRVDAKQLPQLTQDIRSELDGLANQDAEIAELEPRLAALRASYMAAAAQLSQARQSAGEALRDEVTGHLQALGMTGARFDACLTPLDEATPKALGLDDVEFRIATLPGAPLSSLGKIASGGELSRVSLAIQVVTAVTANTPTLVFDEVDTGIGGATAEVVGSLLRQLGKQTQVLCVTHLPQVAAQGHHHFVVRKATTDADARAQVTPLAQEDRVKEVARMLGGIEQTDQSIAHAEAMISSVEAS